MSMLVRAMYRPARQKLRSDDLAVKAVGEFEMRLFAAMSEDLASIVSDRGADQAVEWKGRHNAASALCLVGDRASQIRINREIWEEMEEASGAGDLVWTEDDDFMRMKVFFALLENDPEFASGVELSEWQGIILRMEDQRFPDFPGRALVLGRRLVDLEKTEEAISLLTRAATCEFGKEDQVADAATYLRQLLGNA